MQHVLEVKVRTFASAVTTVAKEKNTAIFLM